VSRNPFTIGAAVLAARPEPPVVEQEPTTEEVAKRVIAEVEAADRSDDGPVLRPVGDETPPALEGRVLKSALPGVSDEAWTQFALAMRTQEPDAVSASNELGMFAMRPRRLADFGLMRDLKKVRTPMGRMAWVGQWVAPMTEDAFLASPKLQYKVFAASMQRYMNGMDNGSIETPDDLPDDMTLSGVLAILHRCGPMGLVNWGSDGDRFENTLALYNRTNGVF
jgi:hypothetical protein